ncbi:Arsenite oxidase subunit AioB [subsurface metagenome]
MQTQSNIHDNRAPSCLSRRSLLILGGSAAAVLATLGSSEARPLAAQLVGSKYREKRIARVQDVIADTPIEFDYPAKDIRNVLVKLGEIAGGGIGPDRDIVAFNALCTHMGGPLGAEVYKAKHKVLGPCPLHLTTFDLTRYGMVVSGHATESLPQVMLEIRGDDIVAVGMMGLVYGYGDNPKG